MNLNRIGVALGAGLASALLFVVLIRGTAIAALLAYFAPLPIMIATLGWGFDAGLIALAVACAVVAGAVEPLSGVNFGIVIALPAWGLAAAASLKDLRLPRRPAADPAGAVRASPGGLAIAAACVGMAISLGVLLWMIVAYGGYEKGLAAVADWVQPALQEALSSAEALPDEVSVSDLARLVVKFAPTTIATYFTTMLIVNLYAAARIAQISQRLDRRWPDIPTTFQLPMILAAPTVLALAVWFSAPEPASEIASVFASALALVYVFQGLAVLHALSRKLPARPALIVALYLSCMIATTWVLPAVAAVGLIESFARLRARAAPARPFQT